MSFRTSPRRGYFGLFSKAREKRYTEYITSLSPVMWYRMNETSGTTVVNSGSIGSAVNGAWTAGAGALGQNGYFNNVNAYDFDALASRVVIPSNSGIQNLTTFTIVALIKPDGLGEGGAGTIFYIGNSASAGGFRFATSNTLSFSVDTDATDAAALTNNPATALTLGNWALLFGTYDDTGDRLPRIYRSVGGVATQYGYFSQTAGTGTKVQPNGATIGNFADVRTWDGLIDEIIVFNSVLSQVQMNQISSIIGI